MRRHVPKIAMSSITVRNNTKDFTLFVGVPRSALDCSQSLLAVGCGGIFAGPGMAAKAVAPGETKAVAIAAPTEYIVATNGAFKLPMGTVESANALPLGSSQVTGYGLLTLAHYSPDGFVVTEQGASAYGAHAPQHGPGALPTHLFREQIWLEKPEYLAYNPALHEGTNGLLRAQAAGGALPVHDLRARGGPSIVPSKVMGPATASYTRQLVDNCGPVATAAVLAPLGPDVRFVGAFDRPTGPVRSCTYEQQHAEHIMPAATPQYTLPTMLGGAGGGIPEYMATYAKDAARQDHMAKTYISMRLGSRATG